MILSFWGCEDFFSTTIDVDPPEYTPQLAATAIFNSTDTTVQVYVDNSKDIFASRRFGGGGESGLDGATIEVVRGNGTISTFGSNSFEGIYQGFLSAFEDNEEITINISHPDYETITATQKVPTKVIPTNYRYIENAGTDEYGYATSGVEITFDDPPGESNFYEVALLFKDSVLTDPINEIYEYYFNQTYNTSLDPNASQGPNYSDLFVSDVGFDGDKYKLLVQFEDYGDQSNSLVVVFNSITEARFKYAKSLRAFSDSGDFGPFGEPVTIFSNFENGLGTFGFGNPHIEEL